MQVESAAPPPSPAPQAPWRRGLARLAVAGVLVHALFLPISIAGMQIGLGVALLALVGLRVSGARAWARGPLDVPCLLLVGGALASLLLGTLGGSPPVGWFEATLWRSVLAPLVIFSALRATGAPAPRWALAALAVWAAAALVPSALAWAQTWTGIDPLHALGLRARPVRATVPTFPGRFAAVGFFKWYQRLAHNLTPPLCLAAAVALVPGLDRRLRTLLGLAAVAAASAVVFTLSRAAWVALVVGAVVIVVTATAGRVRRLGLALVAITAAAMLLHPGVQARLRHLAVRGDNADRVEIWNVCRAVIADHPLTGVGWGNLPRRAIPYYERIQRLGEMRAWCHDTFLSAWAEGGPLLFAAVVGFWVLLLRAFWRTARAPEPLARAASAGALAALAAMLLNALVHDVFYSSEAVYGLGFALGIAAVLASPLSARAAP